MTRKATTLRLADLFCGAGGTSTGAVEAAQSLGYTVEITAINHWEVAVATHTANHPTARHRCASLDSVNPRELFNEGELDGLLASPECMGHSVALGGRPVNDQSRATAWCVLRWADALRPPFILIENVPEFENWAPLGSNGRPLASKRGEVFQSWCNSLRSLGYKVDHRTFCAADYGDPTTRRRLFIQAVRGRRKIVWPHPTHHPVGAPTLFASRPWVAAREIIDWKRKGASIFGRKRPLSPKTMARIREGAEKFWPEPFVVALRGTSDEQIARCCRSVNDPLATVTSGNHLYVAEPLIVRTDQTGGNGHCVRSAGDPLFTVTTNGGTGVAEPFLVQVNHGNGSDANGNARRAKSINDPLPTVCGTRGEMALILPQLSGGRVRSVNEPIPTVTTTSRGIGLLEPFIISAGGPECGARPVSDPLGTVLTRDHRAVVEPLIIGVGGPTGSSKAQPVSKPMGSVMCDDRRGVVEPLLIEFYGNGGARPVDEPLPTVTTHDRFGLAHPIVTINGDRYYLDILFRMLQPDELAGAQGFPRTYQFTGNKTEIVRQIGNAVPRRLARALVTAIVSQNHDVSHLCDEAEVAA